MQVLGTTSTWFLCLLNLIFSVDIYTSVMRTVMLMFNAHKHAQTTYTTYVFNDILFNIFKLFYVHNVYFIGNTL